MPVCQGCGGSYDDKFNFCPYCERAKPEPLKVEVNISSITEKMEVCRIDRRYDNRDKFLTGYFYAEAIDPNGKYLAGESPLFREVQTIGPHQKMSNSGAGIAHTFLVNQLTRDGWEAIASNGEWWQTQFRRRADGNYQKSWTLWWTSLLLPGSNYCFALNGFKSTTKTQGFETFIYEKSIEYKWRLNLISVIGMGISKQKIKKEKDEILQNLEKFVRKLANDGFEPVDYDLNEQLKKCLIAENPNSTLAHRILLKR
jgi:hypothetical protein